MIKMKNILAEQMLKFGTKNLTEAHKRSLRLLMEQSKITVDPSKDAALKKYLINWWDNGKKTQDFSFTPYITKDYIVARKNSDVEGESNIAFDVIVVHPVKVVNKTGSYVLPAVANTILEMYAHNRQLTSFGDLYISSPLSDNDVYVDFNDLKTTGQTDNALAIADWLNGALDPAGYSSVGIAAFKQYLDLIKANFATYATEAKKSADWVTTYNKVKFKGMLDYLGYKPV